MSYQERSSGMRLAVFAGIEGTVLAGLLFRGKGNMPETRMTDKDNLSFRIQFVIHFRL